MHIVSINHGREKHHGLLPASIDAQGPIYFGCGTSFSNEAGGQETSRECPASLENLAPVLCVLGPDAPIEAWRMKRREMAPSFLEMMGYLYLVCGPGFPSRDGAGNHQARPLSLPETMGIKNDHAGASGPYACV